MSPAYAFLQVRGPEISFQAGRVHAGSVLNFTMLIEDETAVNGIERFQIGTLNQQLRINLLFHPDGPTS